MPSSHIITSGTAQDIRFPYVLNIVNTIKSIFFMIYTPYKTLPMETYSTYTFSLLKCSKESWI